MRYSTSILLGLTLALTTAAAVANPPEGKGKHGRGGKPDQQQGTEDLVRAGISAAAAHALLRETGLPSAHVKPLPPGIRKNLARGKPVPPGIAKKGLPQPYLDRLPAHPGYEWRQAGADLILVRIGAQIIADVLSDVFR